MSVGLLLLDHLVCTLQERLRDRKPERLGGLEIDDEVELVDLLNGQISGARAQENALDVPGTEPAHGRVAHAVAGKPPFTTLSSSVNIVGSFFALAVSMTSAVSPTTIASAPERKASVSPARSARSPARSSSTDPTRCSTSSTFSWRAASRASFMSRCATRLFRS